MSSLGTLVEEAEQLFAAGDVTAARRALEDLEPHSRADPAVHLEVLNDLAVIASSDGRLEEAEGLLLSALAVDPRYVPALHTLAGVCASVGDEVQASHFYRRAAEANPADPQLWRDLAGSLTERRRFADALEAVRRAGSTAPEAADLARRATALAPAPGAAPDGGRALIVVDYFHPSLGGSERLAESAGSALIEQGWEVHVATRALPERTGHERLGMRVHEIAGDPLTGLTDLVSGSNLDAIVIFSGPTSWPLVAGLQLPHPRPRVCAVPCINAEGYAMLSAHPQLRSSYAQLLAQADTVVYSSNTGYDVRLCEELGLKATYVPNASNPAPGGSAPAGLDPARPLLLSVGNMWPEKNHPGLLRALAEHGGDWQLAMIGNPSPEAPHVADEVTALAAADPRVKLLGGVPPETVAAAIRRADVFLLPSLAEATPLVLLEAMACGTPWIATPTCGSAHDHGGGLIVPLRLFGEAIDYLLAHPDAARELGQAGLAHWAAAYSWDVIGPRYSRVLAGVEPGPLAAPAGAQQITERVRADFFDRRPTARLAA